MNTASRQTTIGNKITPSGTPVLNSARCFEWSDSEHRAFSFSTSDDEEFKMRWNRWARVHSQECDSPMKNDLKLPISAVAMTPFRTVRLIVLVGKHDEMRGFASKEFAWLESSQTLDSKSRSRLERGIRRLPSPNGQVRKSNPRSVRTLTTGSRETILGDSRRTAVFPEHRIAN